MTSHTKQAAREIPGFIWVTIPGNDITAGGSNDGIKYVGVRSIAEFSDGYVLVDQAHALSCRESLAEIVAKIERAIIDRHVAQDAKGLAEHLGRELGWVVTKSQSRTEAKYSVRFNLQSTGYSDVGKATAEVLATLSAAILSYPGREPEHKEEG